jgi:hypothetical protein
MITLGHHACRRTISEEKLMGLDAQVIAIGPYSQAVAGSLEYPQEYYEACQMREGATVIVTVFVAYTSAQSLALAEALGASAWDFNTHVLDATRANLEALEVDASEVRRFEVLREAGFQFYYLPNG